MREKAGKRILILSDSDLLFNVIEANLKQAHLEVERFEPRDRNLVFSERASYPDLIVVASSSPASEPIVSLFKAALIGQIGQTPLLIISDRKFEADKEGRIFHLEFPFDPDALHDRVQTLLDHTNTKNECSPNAPLESTRFEIRGADCGSLTTD